MNSDLEKSKKSNWKLAREKLNDHYPEYGPLTHIVPAIISLLIMISPLIFEYSWTIKHLIFYYVPIFLSLPIASYYYTKRKCSIGYVFLMCLLWPIGLFVIITDTLAVLQYWLFCTSSFLPSFAKLLESFAKLFAQLLEGIAALPALTIKLLKSKPKELPFQEPHLLPPDMDRGYREPVICLSCGSKKPIEE